MEITSYLSHLKDGKMVPEGNGTGWKCVESFAGTVKTDVAPSPDEIRAAILDGRDPFRPEYEFKAGTKGYTLLRTIDRGNKKDSDGNELLKDGEPIPAGSFAIWTK